VSHSPYGRPAVPWVKSKKKESRVKETNPSGTASFIGQIDRQCTKRVATTKHGKIVDMRLELAVKSMGKPNQICVPMNWL
jgi:hypothetical protein